MAAVRKQPTKLWTRNLARHSVVGDALFHIKYEGYYHMEGVATLTDPHSMICDKCKEREVVCEFANGNESAGAREWPLCDSCLQQFVPGGFPSQKRSRRRSELRSRLRENQHVTGFPFHRMSSVVNSFLRSNQPASGNGAIAHLFHFQCLRGVVP